MMAQYIKPQDIQDGEQRYEVLMIAAGKDGEVVTATNPFPVTLGSENITITGDVNVGTTVSVTSTPEDPVHTHVTEVGTSGILVRPNLPISIQTAAGVENSAANPIYTSSTGALSFNATASDAFGRLRTSIPLTLFDSSHRYSDNGLWDTSTVSGGSTAFDADQGLVNLTLTTAANASVIRETSKVFAYQPGKSLLVLNTFVPATPKANLLQRIGYFGTRNGMYYEINGTTAAFVKRSAVTGSIVETKISRLGGVYGAGDTGWNIDQLDGTGPSGLTFANDKAQILWMDIEWLGLGTVRMGFVIDGQFVHCHSFHHANIVTSTYITTACLPLRYEITNTAATATASTLKQICSSVISEGGYNLHGIQQAVGTPITTPSTLTTAGTYYPVISVRLKTSPDRLDAVAILSALSIMGQGNGVNFNWRLITKGATTGGSWLSAGTNSSVDYNISGTSFSGGTILASGFINSSNQGSPTVDIPKDALFKFQMERNSFTSTPYELTLVVAAGTGTELVFASLDWEEITR